MPGNMKKKPAMKKPAKKPGVKPAKMPTNPLDAAIIKGKKLPSKNKRPGRYLDK